MGFCRDYLYPRLLAGQGEGAGEGIMEAEKVV
jgi:hypothetical protein